MTEREPPTSLETLVRADLDRRADAIDARALFERIRETAESQGPASLRLPVGRRVVRWISGISAAAAAVLIVVLLATQSATPAQASAESLLLEARKQLQVPIDRCYLVEMRKESDLLDQEDPRAGRTSSSTQPTRNSLLQQSRMTLLWTRGDQFWMTPINAPQPFAWGRGKAGDYWIAVGPRRGVQFAPYEVPPPLLRTADILSMQVDRLLDDVLKNFDLTRVPPSDQSPTTIVIKATLKPGSRHPALHSARIEFDEQTKVIRKLVIGRSLYGQPVATLTYRLVDTDNRDDRSYELVGHLEPEHELFDAANEMGRRMLMRRLFDPATAEPAPMRPMNPNGPMSVPGQRMFPPRPQPPATQPATRDGL